MAHFRLIVGMYGPICMCVSDLPVAADVPLLEDLQMCGECLEGGSLWLEYSYKGGFEGETKFQWCHVENSGVDWIPVEGATQRVGCT